jgi:hypothetical protein
MSQLFHRYTVGQPADGPDRLLLDGKSIANLEILANSVKQPEVLAVA